MIAWLPGEGQEDAAKAGEGAPGVPAYLTVSLRGPGLPEAGSSLKKDPATRLKQRNAAPASSVCAPAE